MIYFSVVLLVNKISNVFVSVINGGYVLFYYSGGVLGLLLLGLVY